MTPGIGEGVEGGPPRAATAVAMGARGELTGGMERERRGLGQVEEDLGVLTSSGIGPRWPRSGDRQGCPVFLGKTEEAGLERGGRRVAGCAAW